MAAQEVPARTDAEDYRLLDGEELLDEGALDNGTAQPKCVLAIEEE